VGPGRHVDSDDATSLAGPLGTTTDSLGHYTISGLAAGAHQLRFSYPGYTPLELRVVLADSSSDIGLIAYEMAMLVKRVGQNLSSPTRPPGTPPDG